MKQEGAITRAGLKTPRAAGIAGIVFSILFIVSLVLIRISVPANPQEAGAWLSDGQKTVSLALHLLPFAGIAFLWFIGVLRDRIGPYEDRFFATVFLGSGLLAPVSCHAVCLCGGGGRYYDGLRNDARQIDGVGHIHLRPHRSLPDHKRLRRENGGSVHDFNQHALDPNEDLPALD